ncbi:MULTISPECIES: AsmA family protein [unclassified Methylophaga]|jgi:AsmA protein|uniref:AsmA family protein n=1 Tax=unclassified Methylophaga TaxID=2629249 RepID=UPI000C99766C|nr:MULTISPECIES: AsmA family protein [unclassified Methylophaga]MAK66981.1 AsmA family protein [Methylophaga sp.]MAY18018.1 AsmA family protein [Methylophaga sp.]|tara:strand:+ start:7007 stop:9475 length:2469 start_codon:yes stop_codon:yes gene_type:complete
MRTFIKLIIAIIIIAIAALAALPFIIDPNDYKDEIAAQVEKATGRKLTLQGDIGLSVFPWIALELGPLSLSNASGFKAESFASVQAAEIRIKLMPLLKKQLEMDTIVLDGLLLNLETNEQGVTNWDDLTKADEISDDATATTSESPSTEPSGGLAAISIAGVKLTNANVLWSDASKDENFQLRNLNLDTDPLVPGQPTALTTSFDLISSKPEVKAHIKLDSKVIVDLENQIYALESLKFNTVANSSAMPLQQANLDLQADINANMASELVTINNLKLDLQATGSDQKINASVNGLIEANLGSQQHRITNLAITADIEDEKLPGGKAKLEVNSNIIANLADETFQANDLVIKLADLTMSGRLQGDRILSDDLAFNGNVQVKPFNLRKLANDLKIELPEMADNTTLELVQLSSEISGSKNSINAKDLQLTLDQSQFAGQFGISNFEKPAYTFNLTLDQIDADRYLPPAKEDKENTAKEVATPSTAATGGASELPLETLRDINAKGSFKIGKLKASGISSENILITIDAKDGLIKLSPLAADLYMGKYQGNVSLDARADSLKLAVDENLQGVQAGPLLKDLTGNDRISGTANASVKLNGSGKDVDAIKQSLDGNGAFSFTDGALKGINIAEAIRQAKALLSGQKAAESNEPVQTDFSSLKGTFTAKQGIVNNQDLELMSPLLRVTGAGDIDIPREVIDYAVRVSIVGTAEGQGGKTLEDLKGLTIPVKITGSFDNPRPKVDMASVIKDQATGEVKAKAEEKLKEKLGDGLGGLLGGKLGIESKSDASSEPVEESATEEKTSEEAPEKESSPSTEDLLKEKLKGLF